MVFVLALVGAVVGSFLGALTWRWPRNISIATGRSFCPHCKHQIRWYDNVPIISFLYLRGKCRDCGIKIPRRDFAIELSLAVAYPFIYFIYEFLTRNIEWLLGTAGVVGLILVLLLFTLTVGVFIVDLEHQYIPDTMVFVMIAIVLSALILQSNQHLFIYLAAGLGASLFLLIIHLFTSGRGMGLGDVKLVLALGLVLGFPLTVVFMFLAFTVGSVIGVILILMGRAGLKQRIAFGPFLIFGAWLAALVGDRLLAVFYL